MPRIVAKRATDARVVVDVVATNGTAPPRLAGNGGNIPAPLISAPVGGGDPAGRIVAELSGGYYTSLEMASKATAKIDQATRFSYLLGYSPSNPDLDGKYRDVEVKVNRPGLTVRYRHGYFSAEQPEPLEMKDLLVKSRLEIALAIDQQAKDIPITATVTRLPKMGIQTELRVEITIGAAPLVFPLRDGVRLGQLEVQVYAGDTKEVATGSSSSRLEIKASDEQYQQWLQSGIRRTMRVASFGPPKFVKSDRVRLRVGQGRNGHGGDQMKSILAFSLVLVATAWSVQTPPQTPPPQTPPVFRGGTDVVPLTVTVTDKNGAPVRDLKASDFTVIENKSRREIVNFFPQELAPETGPVPVGEVTPARVKESGIRPQTRRTFLIVLGYGRIEHPTDALEGANRVSFATGCCPRTSSRSWDSIARRLYDGPRTHCGDPRALPQRAREHRGRHQ
jgi:hypothetical protein